MEYEERVVAYIDILGFKESIKKSNDDKNELKNIFKTLTGLRDEFITEKTDYEREALTKLNADTQFIAVSDCLIISKRRDELGGIDDLFLECSNAIHLLIEKGYLCRGAIKVGKMYHKDTTLFGPAFVEAYKAESNERLPIIKFDNELFNIASQYPGQDNNASWEVAEVKKHCKELMTGIYYLDYFTDYDARCGSGNKKTTDHYTLLRNIIIEGLNVKEAYEKYRWAADQFNKTAKNYGLDQI